MQRARLVVKEARGKRDRSNAWEQLEIVKAKEASRTQPEINVPLNVPVTKQLMKAKRRMENSFIDDYQSKMKLLKEMKKRIMKVKIHLQFALVFMRILLKLRTP